MNQATVSLPFFRTSVEYMWNPREQTISIRINAKDPSRCGCSRHVYNEHIWRFNSGLTHTQIQHHHTNWWKDVKSLLPCSESNYKRIQWLDPLKKRGNNCIDLGRIDLPAPSMMSLLAYLAKTFLKAFFASWCHVRTAVGVKNRVGWVKDGWDTMTMW